MKTTVSLSDPVFEAAEQLARRLRISRSELYASAIVEFVERHRRMGVTALLNQVYGVEDSALDPVLDVLERRGLPRGDW